MHNEQLMAILSAIEARLQLLESSQTKRSEVGRLLSRRRRHRSSKSSRVSSGWSPSFDPPTVSDAIAWASDRIQSIGDIFSDIGNDIADGLSEIFQDAQDCLAILDHSRLTIDKIVRDVSNELLEDILDPILDWLNTVFAAHPHDPQPRVYQLMNPRRAFHQDAPPEFEEIIDPRAIFGFQYPVFYTHGLGIAPAPENAFAYWKPFELEYRLFQTADERKFIPLLVNWDSTVDYESLIIPSSSDVLIPPEIKFILGFRAEEQNAKAVGEFLRPFVRVSTESKAVFAASHSLGSLVWSSAVSGTAKPNGMRWWNFEAAVPFHAYDQGEEYEDVGNLFQSGNSLRNELYVWHSSTDIVLKVFYTLATGGVHAMGSIGPSIFPRRGFWELDTYAQTATNHGGGTVIDIPPEYFSRIGDLIRRERKTPF